MEFEQASAPSEMTSSGGGGGGSASVSGGGEMMSSGGAPPSGGAGGGGEMMSSGGAPAASSGGMEAVQTGGADSAAALYGHFADAGPAAADGGGGTDLAAAAVNGMSAKETVDGGLDRSGQLGLAADLGISTAEAAGKEMGVLGKAMPGVGSAISGISAINDVKNAVNATDPAEKNMAWAKAAYDGVSAIPGLGTVLGVADNVVGKGVGKAIGWDDEKEGGSMMTYGTERLMEKAGILTHADSASEKASKAQAHDMMQQEASGAPAANPINPLAPDPNASADPLYVPPGIPRPPGM